MLDRTAGLETQAVLLPNRKLARFDPNRFSEMFLDFYAARVRCDGTWRYSMPMTEDELPFGQLPWQFQGSVGLLAQPNKVEFIPIPPFPPSDSTIRNTGEFVLAPDGSLSGHAERRLTGVPAIILRTQLRKLTPSERPEAVETILKAEFPAATTAVQTVAGVDDPDAQLKYDFDLNWSGYAVPIRKRMIFRPSVFHANSQSPFASESRHNLVEFPYEWREIDELSLQIPAGFEFESPSAPASYPGTELNYQVDLAYAAPTRQLHLRRDFSSALTYVQPVHYAALRRIYANVARSDSHELILTKARTAAGSPEPAAADRPTQR